MNNNDKLERILYLSDLQADLHLLVNGGKAKAIFGDDYKWTIECEVTGQVLDCESFADFKWTGNVLTVSLFGEVFDIELVRSLDFETIF
jgi:hypothetical protein